MAREISDGQVDHSRAFSGSEGSTLTAIGANATRLSELAGMATGVEALSEGASLLQQAGTSIESILTRLGEISSALGIPLDSSLAAGQEGGYGYGMMLFGSEAGENPLYEMIQQALGEMMANPEEGGVTINPFQVAIDDGVAQIDSARAEAIYGDGGDEEVLGVRTANVQALGEIKTELGNAKDGLQTEKGNAIQAIKDEVGRGKDEITRHWEAKFGRTPVDEASLLPKQNPWDYGIGPV